MPLLALIADAHLSSGKTGKLDEEFGLDQTLVDRFRAFRWCVADAAAQPDLILVAGDVFNSPTPTPTEWDLARQALSGAGPTPVVLLVGNHDLAKADAETDAAYMLSTETIEVFARPNMIRFDDLPLQIACVPWPNRQQLLASRPDLSPMGAEAAVREGMMDVIRGLAAERKPGVPAILLGHFAVDVAEVGSESRMMGLGAEWTLNAHELAAMGWDAVLLGHVHRAQDIEGVDVPMLYPGSCCEMDYGEEANVESSDEFPGKGYWLYELEGKTAHWRQNPFNRRHFTVAGEDELPWDVQGAYVKVRLPHDFTGEPEEICRDLKEEGAFEVRIEREVRPTERRREVTLAEGQSREDQLRQYLAHTYPNEDVEALMEEFVDLEATA